MRRRAHRRSASVASCVKRSASPGAIGRALFVERADDRGRACRVRSRTRRHGSDPREMTPIRHRSSSMRASRPPRSAAGASCDRRPPRPLHPVVGKHGNVLGAGVDDRGRGSRPTVPDRSTRAARPGTRARWCTDDARRRSGVLVRASHCRRLGSGDPPQAMAHPFLVDEVSEGSSSHYAVQERGERLARPRDRRRRWATDACRSPARARGDLRSARHGLLVREHRAAPRLQGRAPRRHRESDRPVAPRRRTTKARRRRRSAASAGAPPHAATRPELGGAHIPALLVVGVGDPTARSRCATLYGLRPWKPSRWGSLITSYGGAVSSAIGPATAGSYRRPTKGATRGIQSCIAAAGGPTLTTWHGTGAGGAVPDGLGLA